MGLNRTAFLLASGGFVPEGHIIEMVSLNDRLLGDVPDVLLKGFDIKILRVTTVNE